MSNFLLKIILCNSILLFYSDLSAQIYQSDIDLLLQSNELASNFNELQSSLRATPQNSYLESYFGYAELDYKELVSNEEFIAIKDLAIQDELLLLESSWELLDRDNKYFILFQNTAKLNYQRINEEFKKNNTPIAVKYIKQNIYISNWCYQNFAPGVGSLCDELFVFSPIINNINKLSSTDAKELIELLDKREEYMAESVEKTMKLLLNIHVLKIQKDINESSQVTDLSKFVTKNIKLAESWRLPYDKQICEYERISKDTSLSYKNFDEANMSIFSFLLDSRPLYSESYNKVIFKLNEIDKLVEN